MKNKYSTNASFDYEAIYKFQNTGDAGRVSVYDNSPVASAGDWFVTRKEFLQNNPNGNYLDYVNAERAAGINVGQGMSPGKRTGSTSYTQGSLGLLLQPSFNYYLSDYVALNLGVYYMIQPFKNSAQSGYRLENGIGTYSSVLNNVTASTNQDYGINIGAKFFFRKKEQKPLVITSIDHKSTSDCKLCDGSFTLHGLTPNEPVTVDYSFNGGTISSNTSTVQADGQVNVSHLCAGNYTDISAVIYKQKANGKPLTISDPMLAIVSQIPSNPSAAGCDGSLKIFGLGAGKSATVSYQRNGVLQTSYTAIVNSDNSINLVGLCEGKYTGIEAAVGNCTVSAADFVLTAPVAAPAPIRDIVEEEIDISTPILFDFNQSTIHISSYPQLNEASKQLIEKGDLYIRIDAHTDSKGSNEYNQKLSERRALSVKTYLKGKGANTAKISMHGHGKTEPAASNDTDEGRSKNRRAIMTKTIKL